MIRVAVISDSLLRARSLVTALGEEEERLEIVEVRKFSGDTDHGPSASVDVLVTVGLLLDQIPLNGPPVVALSSEPIDDMPLEVSIRAWLPISSSALQVAAAIVAAANELIVLTQRQMSEWPGSQRSAHRDGNFEVEALTPRELQVLRMLADGLGNKEIAGQLDISDHTAKFHVAQILAKLRASSRTEAVAIGMRRGLVPV